LKAIRISGAIICFVVGLVWIGQGFGLIRGSVMTGRLQWSAAGVALLVIAAWQLILLTRSRKL